MSTTKPVRLTVSLPAEMAREVRKIAKEQRLSSSRVLGEMVEQGLELLRLRLEGDPGFFELAKRFRAARDPGEVGRLGDELGRLVFGG